MYFKKNQIILHNSLWGCYLNAERKTERKNRTEWKTERNESFEGKQNMNFVDTTAYKGK